MGFFSEYLLSKFHVFGLPTGAKTMPPQNYDADETVRVFDVGPQFDAQGKVLAPLEAHRPVFVRIQNLGTEPIRFAEDLGTCDETRFSGVIPGGSGIDTGDGGTIEWQHHRPNNVYIHADNAYRCVIVLRYTDED